MPVKIEAEEEDSQEPLQSGILVLDPHQPSASSVGVLDHYHTLASEVLSREVRQEDESPPDESPLIAIATNTFEFPVKKIFETEERVEQVAGQTHYRKELKPILEPVASVYNSDHPAAAEILRPHDVEMAHEVTLLTLSALENEEKKECGQWQKGPRGQRGRISGCAV